VIGRICVLGRRSSAEGRNIQVLLQAAPNKEVLLDPYEVTAIIYAFCTIRSYKLHKHQH
jgi:hypothetical protein